MAVTLLPNMTIMSNGITHNNLGPVSLTDLSVLDTDVASVEQPATGAQALSAGLSAEEVLAANVWGSGQRTLLDANSPTATPAEIARMLVIHG